MIAILLLILMTGIIIPMIKTLRLLQKTMIDYMEPVFPKLIKEIEFEIELRKLNH